jgi:hypothetical protein
MAVAAEADPEAVFAVPLTVRPAAVGQDHLTSTVGHTSCGGSARRITAPVSTAA